MALKTIRLRGTGIRKEGVALGTINPGELIERAPTGIQVHGTADENTSPAFALENELFGSGIDVPYLINEQVLFEVFPPGGEVYGFLQASSAAVVIGDLLVSGGDGTFIKFVPEVDLTDSTTGTPSDTLADATGSFSQTIENNNMASVATKINAMLPAAMASACFMRAIEAVTPTGSDTRCRMEVI
jgi:hypothetical protein